MYTSHLKGVDKDLRVRPFFAHGATFSLRAFIVGAFKDEMGLEAPDPILCKAKRAGKPRMAVTPGGLVLDPALVDHLEFYLLNYFKPATGQVTRRARQGLKLIRRIGCTSCHVQDLRIERDRRVADVETRFDPQYGIFNRLFATATTLFRIVIDGESLPQLLPKGEPFLVKNIFADFKRHDLGPAFHERDYDGTIGTEFKTEPLCGVGSTPPYRHDGRSINLMEVILRHGGEAQASRDEYAAANPNNQHKIIEFLDTLVIFPPDDTASNLNPGVPGSGDPQDPLQHGSINLGALLQDASEGAE